MPKQAKVYPVWEYKLVYNFGNKDMINELNDQLGPQGWELCGMVCTSEPDSSLASEWPKVIRYYFKRPKR